MKCYVNILNISMTHSNEIQENLVNYEAFVKWYDLSSYASKTMDESPRWEIREALSYFLEDTEVINYIADAIIHKNVISWNALTLVNEARLQLRLRNMGYDLHCVDNWPCVSKEFSELLEKNPSVVRQFRYKISSKIASWCKPIIPYYTIIFCIAALIYYQDWWMFAISILVSHLLFGVNECIFHEYLQHRYIIPKNKFIKHLVETFLFFVNPNWYINKPWMIRSHQYHHLYYKTDRDPQSRVLKEEFKQWCKNPGFFTRPNEKNMNRLLNEFSDFPYIIKYLIEIRILLSIIAISLFGLKYFIFFFIIPVILKQWFTGLADGWFLILGERDHPWVFPITFNQSCHVYHHRTGSDKHKSWDTIFGGPRWLKYFNYQYYTFLLFFKIKHSAK